MQFDQLKRREFITLIGGVVGASLPRRGLAQQGAKPSRVGYLGGASGPGGQALAACFRAGLRDLGWVEGRSIEIEYRWAGGVLERYALLSDELVGSKPDLLVATSTPGAQAAQRATRQIPIVFIAVSDPVASGIVSSLARPGANITGVSNFLPATTGKLLEFLKTLVASASRIGVIYNPDNHGKLLEFRELQDAAVTMNVAIEPLSVRSSGDLDATFETIARLRCDGLIALLDGVTLANRSRIAQFAERGRLPAIYQVREFVEAGGLMSYGLNYCRHFRRAAVYADKVLRGARPAELPVELPTSFELTVNMKTAKAIGLPIPESFLLRADEVFE
jgi:putative ABC transport system substrate-binding protein